MGPTGNMHDENSRGPQTEPWGTPQVKEAAEEERWLMWEEKVLSKPLQGRTFDTTHASKSKNAWTV